MSSAPVTFDRRAHAMRARPATRCVKPASAISRGLRDLLITASLLGLGGMLCLCRPIPHRLMVEVTGWDEARTFGPLTFQVADSLILGTHGNVDGAHAGDPARQYSATPHFLVRRWTSGLRTAVFVELVRHRRSR